MHNHNSFRQKVSLFYLKNFLQKGHNYFFFFPSGRRSQRQNDADENEERDGCSGGKTDADENDEITVSFKVKNTGTVAGAEIAQLYVADKESTIFRPVKELKGFKKVFLEAGEEKEISIKLGKPGPHYSRAVQPCVI